MPAVSDNPANEKAAKKILLVSNFLYQAAGSTEDESFGQLVDGLNDRQILLEVCRCMLGSAHTPTPACGSSCVLACLGTPAALLSCCHHLSRACLGEQSGPRAQRPHLICGHAFWQLAKYRLCSSQAWAGCIREDCSQAWWLKQHTYGWLSPGKHWQAWSETRDASAASSAQDCLALTVLAMLQVVSLDQPGLDAEYSPTKAINMDLLDGITQKVLSGSQGLGKT